MCLGHRARKVAKQGCKIQDFQTIQFSLQFLYLLQISQMVASLSLVAPRPRRRVFCSPVSTTTPSLVTQQSRPYMEILVCSLYLCPWHTDRLLWVIQHMVTFFLWLPFILCNKIYDNKLSI